MMIGLNSVYLPHTSIDLKFLSVSRDTTLSHPLNPYLYTIEVTHGDFKWIIHKRFKHLRELHDRLWAIRTGLKIPLPSKTHKEKRKTVKGSKRSDPKLPRFPKRPDIWVSAELIEKRQKQLETYVNAVLTSPMYRKHNIMKKFLEVSRFSFIEDLGIKGKEGMLKKKSGGHRIKLFFCDKCCNWRFREMFHSWGERWFVVKDTFIMYLDQDQHSVKGILLFDHKLRVDRTENSNKLAITNSSRTLTVKCWTSRQAGVWRDAIMNTGSKYASDFVTPNQFGSFAPLRETAPAHWFVDGSSYFSAVADALEDAKEEIFITDWWLSPQIYLKRPMVHGDKWQLDKLLKRKADAGVKIYILLYKEVEMAVALESRYAKDILQGHNMDNIRVLRHPDHITTTADSFLWAHHEKIVVIDQTVAFVGGIDLCYGRWDNHEHRLTDTGKGKDRDYSVEDVTDSFEIGALKACELKAHCALSMMWSEIKVPHTDEPTPNTSHVFKAFQAMTVAVVEEVSRDYVNNTNQSQDTELNLRKLSVASSGDSAKAGGNGDADSKTTGNGKRKPESTTLLSANIGSGYGSIAVSDTVPLITDSPASHASQPWATSAGQEYKGIVQNIKKVGQGKLWVGKDYCNFVMKDLANLNAPYEDHINRQTTPRMPWHDIACVTYGKPARDAARHFIQRWNFTKIEKAKKGESVPFLLPKSYSEEFFNLAEDRIHPEAVNANVQILRSCSEWSAGLSNPELSIQTAYIDAINNAEHFIYIENQFFISARNDPDINNKIVDALFFRILRAHEERKKFRVYVVMPLIPGFEGDISNLPNSHAVLDSPSHHRPITHDSSKSLAIQAVMYWQYRSIIRGEGSLLGDLLTKIGNFSMNYVSFCGLRAHSELGGKPITEIVYVHSKMLIVDDRKVIIGSANVNDRSMTGLRDSEVAMYIEDTQFIDSTMDGSPYKVGRFSSRLRKRVFAEHLGLLPEDFVESNFEPTVNIDDVVSENFFKEMWLKVAGVNTTVYEKVFKCVPSDSVSEFSAIAEFQRKPMTDDEAIRTELEKIRGYLVLLPLFFLRNESLRPEGLTKESVAPTALWT